MDTRKVAPLAGLALAALVLAAALPERAAGDGIVPFGCSYDDLDQQPGYDVGVAGVRLALGGAANRFMYGLSVGFFNGKLPRGNSGIGLEKKPHGGDGDMAGLQVAVFSNDSDGARFGAWQVAGLSNFVRDGGGNLFQLAGVLNLAEGPMQGLQVAGVFNLASARFAGIQIAGICNVDGGDFSGLQIALVNVSRETVAGIQLGAVNYAKTMRGIQLGVVNVVGEDLKGISLGAFNAKNSDLLPILRIHF